jgi:hypothetical protein
MKHISVTIPDNKVSLFIELMNNLSFVKKVEATDNIDIPDWHKDIIEERTENYKKNPESYKNWKDLKKGLDKKYEL